MRTYIKSLFLIAAASVCLTASAADFVTRTYPLSIDVEGQYLQSTLFLRLQVKDYNLPFEDFAKGERDSYESAFVSFVTALRDNDTVTAGRLIQPERRVAPDVPEVRPERAPAAAIVRGYRAGFGGMKDITVVAQILAGSRHLFIWQARSGVSPIRRAFAVEGVADALAVHEVTSADPVAVLIVNNVMEAMREQPAAYQSLASRSTKFEYGLPVRGADPVVMQFGGSVIDVTPAAVTVAAASTGDSGEVLRAYAETAESLRLHAVDQFLAHFTPKSAANIKRLITVVPEGAYGTMYDLAWQRRHLRLIVGSDPVYIVFYTLGNGSSYKYDYLIRNATTGKLLFANIGRQGIADDVLSHPELFDPSRVIAQQAPATR